MPLREPTLFILLSLANGTKHGYAIIKDVEKLSEGGVRLSTSTLYGALARLLDLNWIERVSLGDVKHPGRRRKVYRLSGRGHQAIEIEVQRMGRLIKTVRQRLGLQLP